MRRPACGHQLGRKGEPVARSQAEHFVLRRIPRQFKNGPRAGPLRGDELQRRLAHDPLIQGDRRSGGYRVNCRTAGRGPRVRAALRRWWVPVPRARQWMGRAPGRWPPAAAGALSGDLLRRFGSRSDLLEEAPRPSPWARSRTQGPLEGRLAFLDLAQLQVGQPQLGVGIVIVHEIRAVKAHVLGRVRPLRHSLLEGAGRLGVVSCFVGRTPSW